MYRGPLFPTRLADPIAVTLLGTTLLEYVVKSPSNGTGSDAVYETVSIAVVHAIATHRNVDPVTLPPLYEWIDPDAIDDLFEPTRTGGPRRGCLAFDYDGQTVTVDCTDGIAIAIDGSPAATSISVRQSNA
ncbi:hypothetical protein HTG_10225 [Natrinema mahii]|nr:hypothetical protein HTG_10225 [Natrinema mahii]